MSSSEICAGRCNFRSMTTKGRDEPLGGNLPGGPRSGNQRVWSNDSGSQDAPIFCPAGALRIGEIDTWE